MTKTYYRPLVQSGPRPANAQTLAGGTLWFAQAQAITRAGSKIIAADDIPAEILARVTAPRAPIAGIPMIAPAIMGILNVTPDSFSDGGLFLGGEAAVARARQMADQGAQIVDIGGESTRPGAAFVPPEEEITRTQPVIAALRKHITTPISIDTRKGVVAQAALTAGADIVNDVAAMTFDPAIAQVTATAHAPICLMHAQGDPKTMQAAPSYDNVLLEVYDFLNDQVTVAVNAGIARDQIIVDPGIGFGKTQDHNLTLLAGLALFHGLGCPILLGASRKRFIGTIGLAPDAANRAPGSIAVALAAVAQGVQIIRAHDVAETAQALRLWQAVHAQ